MQQPITEDPLDKEGVLHHLLQQCSREALCACSQESLKFLATLFRQQYPQRILVDPSENVEAFLDTLFEHGFCVQAATGNDDGKFKEELERVVGVYKETFETKEMIQAVESSYLLFPQGHDRLEEDTFQVIADLYHHALDQGGAIRPTIRLCKKREGFSAQLCRRLKMYDEFLRRLHVMENRLASTEAALTSRIEAAESALETTQAALETTQSTLGTTQAALETTQAALETTQSTLGTTQAALATTQQRVKQLERIVGRVKSLVDEAGVNNAINNTISHDELAVICF
ncbi:hypothetical protein C9374_005624 [Naegleria lovaniensis]|uniref:Uncharacterized protein n=1 Tax=Naegleria lovaniensis TaxID=51637 RepID=A0AA88GQ37_NAELO|nr:uncharacterized protein C9374_005624 [Naegleria lovaniensis]KAG2382422.1 hypothetical protein C9374_005624 [Naegleria lovaniensis]